MNEQVHNSLNAAGTSDEEQLRMRAKRVNELKLMVANGSYRIEPMDIVSNLVKAISDSCDGFNL